jgi:hypothetical protein
MMHPMFVKLFLEPDSDEEEEKRRTAARARRPRSRATVRAAVRQGDRRISPAR